MMEKEMTGYPSVDKPWLKYYTQHQYAPTLAMSAYEYLKQKNQDNLSKVAIRFQGREITYQELFSQIDSVTRGLGAIGVGVGDIIVISIPVCPEEVHFFYAIDQIGGCSNYVIPNTPLEKICGILNDFQAKCFVGYRLREAEEAYIYQHTAVSSIIDIARTDGTSDGNTLSLALLVEKGVGFADIPQRDPTSRMFIAKTGGTTGTPKNVVLSDVSFNAIIDQYIYSDLEYKAGDKWLRLWPIFSATAAVSSNHLPLCLGMELSLAPTEGLMYLDKLLLEMEPQHIPLAPSIMDVLLNSDRLIGKDLSFLKTVGFGGSKMDEDVERSANAFFKSHHADIFVGCGYGMTENGSTATIRMNDATAKIGSVGVPMIDTTVAIFDPNSMEEAPYGTPGEVCIRSNAFMLGYYQEPELTKSVLRKHNDGTIWLHSGDLGHMDEDGLLYIHERMTRLIPIYPSDKAFPSEIEKSISTIRGIKEVAVFGVPDGQHPGFQSVACAATIQAGFSADGIKSDIQGHCSKELILYAQPKEILVVDKLPLTPIGKVDYHKLEQFCIETQAAKP